MDLVQLLEKRNGLINDLKNIVNVGETEKRELTETEDRDIINLQKEIDQLNIDIENKNNNRNKEIKMENFKDLIVRSSDGKVENMEVRALVLASGIDNVTVAGNLSTVGYEPFYKLMGVELMPNLSTSIKLPYVGNIIGAKVGEGVKNATNNTVATVTLQPTRFSIQETVGKELLAVGNESALQAFIFEMAKGCDKAITKEIFDVVIAGATAQAGLTGYTATNLDTLNANVDGAVTVLMPRAEFYKAKGTKVDSGSGLFVANKSSEFAGNLFDGTPLFYSSLFAGTAIATAALKHVTVGEFGESLEIVYDQFTKAGEGQVVITVTKMADVKLRNASAVKKATIA